MDGVGGLVLFVLSVHVLKVLESSARVEALGAGQRAETDLVALAKLHVTTEHLETLISELVTRVDNPAVSLHEHSGTKVVLRVPPVRGASGLAASAQNALVETVEQLALFNSLQVFLLAKVVSVDLLALEVGLNALVLGVEMAHVDD